MERSVEGRLENGLWIAFLALFAVMVVSVYAPVEPIAGVLPFWSVLALSGMLATIVVAVIAVVGYGWSSESR